MKNTNEKMVSLYEFLGHAAGPELGKEVAAVAARAKVSVTSHEVSNRKYTGRILKYPESFLKVYFGTKDLNKLTSNA